MAARLAQANLASKNDNANLVKKTDFDGKLKKLNKRITSNEIKHVLDENELKQWQTFDSSLLLVTITLIMIEHNFFNTITTLLYFKNTRWYWKRCITEI